MYSTFLIFAVVGYVAGQPGAGGPGPGAGGPGPGAGGPGPGAGGPGPGAGTPPPPIFLTGPNNLNITVNPSDRSIAVCHILQTPPTTPIPSPAPSTTPPTPTPTPASGSASTTTTTTTTTTTSNPLPPPNQSIPPIQSGTIGIQLVSVVEFDNSSLPTPHKVLPSNMLPPPNGAPPQMIQQPFKQTSWSALPNCTSFTMPLPVANSSSVTLTTTLCAIQNNDSLDLGGGLKENVFVGQLMAVFNVSNWPWCSVDQCMGQTGLFLEFNISLLIQPDKTISQTQQSTKFTMGFADAYADFPNKYWNGDSGWSQLTNGPIMTSASQSNASVTVRMQRPPATSNWLAYYTFFEPGYSQGTPPSQYPNKPITGASRRSADTLGAWLLAGILATTWIGLLPLRT